MYVSSVHARYFQPLPNNRPGALVVSIELPDRASAVIIGGGVIGTSVAYHLARLGWGHPFDDEQVEGLALDPAGDSGFHSRPPLPTGFPCSFAHRVQRRRMTSQYMGLISTPRQTLPSLAAAISVVPLPQKGS